MRAVDIQAEIAQMIKDERDTGVLEAIRMLLYKLRYASIKANPYGCQVRKGSYRHALLHKLKYRMVFEVEGNTVYIYQVRHTSRKPSKKFGP